MTRSELRNLARKAFHDGVAFTAWWELHGDKVGELEPYSRERFRRLHAQLLQIVLTGMLDGQFPPGDDDAAPEVENDDGELVENFPQVGDGELRENFPEVENDDDELPQNFGEVENGEEELPQDIAEVEPGKGGFSKGTAGRGGKKFPPPIDILGGCVPIEQAARGHVIPKRL